MISSTSLTIASRNRHLLSRVLRSKLHKKEPEVGKKREEKDDQKKVKKSRKFLIELTIAPLLFTGKGAVFRESLVTTVRSNSVSSEVSGGGS